LSVVDVGNWNPSKGEPLLVKVKDQDESQLRSVLVEFLTHDKELTKKRFWRPVRVLKAPLSYQNARSMILEDLINHAEKFLGTYKDVPRKGRSII
jgi:hypothetical protein